MGCIWGMVLALLLYNHQTTARCLKDVPEVNPKRFLYLRNDLEKLQRYPITFDVSRRVTHQITSHIFKIFLEEELGYSHVYITEHNDFFNETDLAHERISAGVGEADRPPQTILNTEMWISPAIVSDTNYRSHRIKLCGTIGPPGRFGWFIPKVLLNYGMDISWKIFLSPEKAGVFSLAKEELRPFINNYYCNESFCVDGMYSPTWCEDQPCATLLAGYLDTTMFVVNHIEQLNLHVRVVWLGPHLAEVVSKLTKNLTNTVRSLVVLTYTPSSIILPDDQDFETVLFPPCSEFGLDTGCKYDLHMLMKMSSTIFADGAKPAYEAYTRLEFNQNDYRNMLVAYRSELTKTRNSSEAVYQVACNWLTDNAHLRAFWRQDENDKTTLYIGGIYPMNPVRSVASYDTRSIIAASQMAQNAVNQNSSLLRDYNLQLLVNDGRCEADGVLKIFIDHIVDNRYKNLVGILGPACSNTLEPLAGVSSHYRTIVISYSAEGSSFSDRKKYPYFFRTIGENNQYQQVYLQLLNKLNWRRLAALTEDGQKYTEYISLLQDLLTGRNYTFVMNRKIPATKEKSASAMKSYLEEMKSKSVRIIIGDMYDDAAREMMCQAYQLQMTAYQSYVWFLPGWLAPDWYDTDKYNKLMTGAEVVGCTTSQMLEAINGHLSLSHEAWAPDSAVMETNQTVGEWRHNFEMELKRKYKRSDVSNYAGYAYDAVWMFALALDQLDKENPSALSFIHSPQTTKRFMEILEKTDFNGVSGRIQFRGNPSRISVVEVRQWIDNITRVVGVFQPNVSALNKDPLAGILHLNESYITWLTPDRSRPKDGTAHCFLGVAEYFGIEDCNLFLIISNGVVVCILCVCLITGFFVLKSRYDKKVQLSQQIMNHIGLDLLNVGNLEKWEIPRDKVVINRKLGEGAFGYVYGGEAKLDSEGWVAVAVKTLKVGSTPEEKLEFLCEAEVMKRFDHKNIIQLLGVCTKNEPVYTVMEFMLYGDLKTFLLARRHLVNEKGAEEADEISSKKLTGMALDVARALSYLAQLKFVHRDVASRNCLVNASRVVKLGDFGMTRPMFDKDYYKFSRKGMLPVRWMSPESLGLGLFTPASDIWSYGVLLYEIITFGSFPFQGMANIEVLEYVKAGNTLPIPTGVKPQAEALIRSCWNIDYKKRPKASEIVEFIANNARLLHPCLDVPLASVQTDDSGSVDLLIPDRFRKFSFSLRNHSTTGIFNSPSQWNNGGVGTPALWSQEYPDQELMPVSEEDLESDRPLLPSSDKYMVVQSPPPPSANEDDSLL